eukprot:Tbor_TRINITY_DN5337_c3_g2::TRINITY_DN5337_c3_g2_i1::g.4218::m.4218
MNIGNTTSLNDNERYTQPTIHISETKGNVPTDVNTSSQSMPCISTAFEASIPVTTIVNNKVCCVCASSDPKASPPKYRCPKCAAPYCSISCCRVHKEMCSTHGSSSLSDCREPPKDICTSGTKRARDGASDTNEGRIIIISEIEDSDNAKNEGKSSIVPKVGADLRESKATTAADDSGQPLEVLQMRHLEAICSHKQIRDYLRTKELRAMIRAVDNSRCRLEAMEASMYNSPDFKAFCDTIIGCISEVECRDQRR